MIQILTLLHSQLIQSLTSFHSELIQSLTLFHSELIKILTLFHSELIKILTLFHNQLIFPPVSCLVCLVPVLQAEQNLQLLHQGGHQLPVHHDQLVQLLDSLVIVSAQLVVFRLVARNPIQGPYMDLII